MALVDNISNKFIPGLDFLMAHGAGEVLLHKPLAFQLARCHQVVAMEDTVISLVQ